MHNSTMVGFNIKPIIQASFKKVEDENEY